VSNLSQASKIKVTQVVLVEGKYDKIKLENIIDATILTTNGFQIFKDPQKRELIRTLAQKNGLVLLTDSDVAGFKIRNYIKSIAPDAVITHLYIPRVYGKEKRKNNPSKEGTLGVEGIDTECLRKLFQTQLLTPSKPDSVSRTITKQDFYRDGLTGGAESSKKRKLLLERLNLPPYLSSNALLQTINRLMSYEEYQKLLQSLSESS
jgi:ribonuclease M5